MMNEESAIQRLFNKYKNSDLFLTLKSGHVKMANGSTYGDWTNMGSVIDPTSREPLQLAEEFFGDHKKAAKELRRRIAEWRKVNIKPEPIKVMYIDGATAEEFELPTFSLASILKEHNIKEIIEARADNFMRCASNVVVQDTLGKTVVTVFDDDGAAEFYIGTDFIGPRDI